MNTFLRGAAGRTLAGAAVVVALLAPCARAAEPDNPIEVVKVRKNFYMLAGGGGNIGVQIGSDGVVLVNAGTAAATPQVLESIKKLTDLPIRYIIDVAADADFVGGNATLAKAGFTIFTNALGNTGVGGTMTNGGAAAILAHESVLKRVSSRAANIPSDAWPTEAFLHGRHAMRMNDEGLEVFYLPNAHSDADSAVLFRGSDVVVTGDIIDMNKFPTIDIANGGTIQGEIEALNRVIDMTIAPIPYIYKDVGTYVIPGHGRLCEQMEVVEYRDMVVNVKDAVEDMIASKKTLDQIKAARPALAFESRYGTQPGVTNNFVEAIYKSLTAKK